MKLGGMIIVAVVVGWFSIHHALLGLLEREYPLIGLSLAPSSPVSAGVVALNRVGRDGDADATTRRFIEQAARGSPLLAEPFITAGIDASARGDTEKALQLFEQARMRDPRSILVRYWLFDYYLRTGKYAEGIDEAQPLVRLQPAVMPGVTSLLTALLDVPGAREILIRRLQANPPWRSEFLRQVAASPRLRAEAGALLSGNGNQAIGSLQDNERIIGGLLRDGNVEEAWQRWRTALPSEARQQANRGAIYDGSFAGWPGAAPFNWSLAKQGVTHQARSAPQQGTGLRLEIIPGRGVTLAQQTVPVSSGSYRLSYTLKALDEQPSVAIVEAQIRCIQQSKPIATRQVHELDAKPTVYAVDADLPDGCVAVQVRFVALPGETAGGLFGVLSGVRLSPRR
jgi:tetratricopeptide (TPR) repeat protein